MGQKIIFYITEDKIVHCKGILTIDEEIYDIGSIRTVKSHFKALSADSLITAMSSWKFPPQEATIKDILLRGIRQSQKIRKNFKRISGEKEERIKYMKIILSQDITGVRPEGEVKM